MTTYKFAVMDGNEAPDQYRFAVSCHHTIEAAKRQADRLNRQNPNYHYYVIPWGAKRWDQERPAPQHPAGL